MNEVKFSELKPGYHIFGNKGSMWSNNLHIVKSGFSSTTLCGTPMLSHNYANEEAWREENHITGARCPECLKKYEQDTSSLKILDLTNPDLIPFKKVLELVTTGLLKYYSDAEALTGRNAEHIEEMKKCDSFHHMEEIMNKFGWGEENGENMYWWILIFIIGE